MLFLKSMGLFDMFRSLMVTFLSHPFSILAELNCTDIGSGDNQKFKEYVDVYHFVNKHQAWAIGIEAKLIQEAFFGVIPIWLYRGLSKLCFKSEKDKKK